MNFTGDERLRALHAAPVLQGGAGKMIVDLSLDGAAYGVEAAVVSSGQLAVQTDWSAYVSRLHERAIPYHQVNLFSREPVDFWRSVRLLKELLADGGYDIVHAHAGTPAAIASAAIDLLTETPALIATFHGWGLNRPEWMNLADAWAFNRGRAVIVLSNYSRRLLLDSGVREELIRVIPGGVDPSLLSLRPDPNLLRRVAGLEDHQGPVAVQLAVIEPRKNQSAVIKALARVDARFNLRVVFIGAVHDPACREELDRMARELGMGERVRFVPGAADAVSLLAGAQCMILPSLSEGFGIAALEAMAVGVPVIASTEEGPGDFIIDGETGLAIDPRDPASIARSVERLLADDSLRKSIAANARELVKSSYLWPTVVGRTVELYREVIRRG